MRLCISKLGLTLSMMLLLVAVTLFALHLHAIAVDPTGSTGSALLFFVLTLPWALALPDWLIGQAWWDRASYYVCWLLVGVNAFLLYCAAGGIRFAIGDRATRLGTKPDLHAARDG